MLKSATSASGARLANTGRGLPRPIDSGDGTGRLTPWQGGAVNLWTVGCADPRLTAQARSPMGRSATAHQLHSNPQQDRMNLISGKGETSSRLPAFSLFLPGSCPNYRDRRNTSEKEYEYSMIS